LIDVEVAVLGFVFAGEVSGEDDDAAWVADDAESLDEGDAAEAGHAVIAQDELEAGGVCLDGVESGFAVLGGGNGIAAEFEGGFDGESDGRFVIGDEDVDCIYHSFHNFGVH